MTKKLKETAIDRLKYLGVYKDAVTDFIENDRVWISDSSSSACQLVLTPVDEELQKQIDKCQEETGGLVYHVIRERYACNDNTGIVDTLLVVMNGRTLLEDGNMNIKNGVVSAFIINQSAPDGFYSALVYVEPKSEGLVHSNGRFDFEAFNAEKMTKKTTSKMVISFFDDTGKRFLVSYYRWSAYTSVMLYEVNQIVKKYKERMNTFCEIPPKQNLLEAFYDLGAGLEGYTDSPYEDLEFKEALEKFYPDEKFPNMQEEIYLGSGLIGITKEEMVSSVLSCDGYVDLVLHDDGSIDFIGSDVYYCDDAEEYCDDFGEDFESFKSALLDSAEESRQTGSLSKDALVEKLQSLDIDLYDGTAFFTEQGDNHLCWKTENGYKSCDLKFIGDGSRYSSFINISDTDVFERPEAVKLITAME